MSDESKFNIDPPDHYASLRRTISLTLLLAIVGCGTLFYHFQYTLSPEELSSRLTRAFPRDSFATWENGSQVTLYSLQTNGWSDRSTPESKPGEFHGYPILGKVSLDESERHQVRLLMKKVLVQRRNIRCFGFAPHHGVRAVSGGKKVDLLICFSCTGMVTYADGQKGDTPINRTPEKYFNQLLKNAGIPFDPQYKH